MCAELCVLLERGGPEMPGVANCHAPRGVGRGDRADSNAGARPCACRTNSTLEVGGRGAESCANASERKICTGVSCSFVAEFAIRGITPPILVAARQQVEQNCPRHDGHAGLTHLKAATLLAKPRLHPRRGVESESRSAGQDDSVDSFHRLRRVEECRFTRTRPTPADIYAGGHGTLEYNNRDS